MSRKPKIAIDFYEIKYRETGLGEYAYSLAQCIAERAAEIDATLYFLVPKGFTGRFGDKVKYINVDAFSRFTRLALRIFPRSYNIYHRIHQFSKTRRLLFAKRNIVTIHDINFIHDTSEKEVEKYTRRTQKILNKADAVVVISNFVERDIRENFEVETPIIVIHNGVTDLSPMAKNPEETGYLFHLSSLMPKKNPLLLVEMMSYLPDEKLVIAGNLSQWGAPLIELANELGLKNITFMNKVNIETKATLMSGCKAFLFPSLCEGFGLPPLEAMKFGKPVFLSNLTSLPEVGGEAAYYWNSLDPKDMAEVVKKELAQNRLSLEDIKKWADEFTWDKTADKYIELYKKILK